MALNDNHTGSEPMLPDFAAVRAAHRRIAGQVILTPCTPSDAFTDLLGGRVWFKFDHLQRTGSFKERGARNKLESLPEEQRKEGVIAASAGNHAQGVAFHATQMGVAATIVMPERTPLIKVSNTEQFGARVVLHGENYDEAMTEALRIREAENLVLIHPFDDPDVIAGQGTIGLELLEQNPEMDAVIVPIGGGGLISGIAMAIKERRPEVQVIGVEAEVVPAALRAREAGHPVTIPGAETIADGISVRRIGDLTFRMIERYVDRIVTVSEEEIANAVLLLLEREKTVVEGAAATPLAALLNARVPEDRGEKRDHAAVRWKHRRESAFPDHRPWPDQGWSAGLLESASIRPTGRSCGADRPCGRGGREHPSSGPSPGERGARHPGSRGGAHPGNKGTRTDPFADRGVDGGRILGVGGLMARSYRRASRREQVLERYGYRCVYCALVYDPEALTVDHVEPRMRGGDQSEGNLVASCRLCNARKGSLPAWAFLATRPVERGNFLRLATGVWPRLRRAVEKAAQ